jgi:2-dehydro-3-deoxyphosphogluconate aldolase/(4S)-4-hydroxy-2-oxoglutarate aldolase
MLIKIYYGRGGRTLQKKLALINRITENGVVAVIRNIPKKKVTKVAESLITGGVTALEVTLDNEDAFHVIERLAVEFKNQAVIGAGTVLDCVSAELAIRSGAEFIVSPVLKEDIIKTTLRNGKISIPGAFTPTEMLTAIELGAHIVKVFPALVGGPAFIKNVSGPLPQISIIPTGGIDLENAAAFIKAGAIAIGVGGNLADNDAISEDNYEQIIETAKKYVKIVKDARKGGNN